MLTNKNEAKTMTKHVSCGCKCKFNGAKDNLNQKRNNKSCQNKCKNYYKLKKGNSWNPSTCICEKVKYLKRIDDTSMIECNEIVTVIDIVSTKMTDTIAKNAMSTDSISCRCKKVRDSYILHEALLAILLLLVIIIICYHYAKQESIHALTI